MLSDWVEPKWQRRRGVRTVHVVAVLCALAAAGGVLAMFNNYGITDVFSGGPGGDERTLIASVDLRIANPAEAFALGEAEARADIEAGQLKLLRFGQDKPPGKAEAAQAQRLKQSHGIVWVSQREPATPRQSAHAAGYNHVVQAEIERRHGRDFLDSLLRDTERDAAKAP